MNQDTRFVLAIWIAALPILIPSLVLSACGAPQTPSDAPYGVEAPPEYDRASWGRWVDQDGDCQDTRQEVLIRDSQIPVTLDESGCKVLTGKWICPYTGVEFSEPDDLDIDHTVALKEAHESGGYAWDTSEKKVYFNDLGELHLQAVSRSANRSKGSRNPSAWLPPRKAARCAYIHTWVRLKDRWHLETDLIEDAVITYMLKICEKGGIPVTPQD